MTNPDPRALQVARAVHHDQNPQITILFGSRGRGGYTNRSDIDVLLIDPLPPDQEHQDAAVQHAENTARQLYERQVPVQLIWRTPEEFRQQRRYTNSLETRAVREGIMVPGPEEYSRHDYDDEETEHKFDWNPFDNHILHAEAHLDAFERLAESGITHIIIGQHAQNTLEFAMKALLEAHGAPYSNTHNIGHLLGAVRRADTDYSEFQLRIPPDIYTAYEGDQQYRQRTVPNLTEYPNYREATVTDAQTIIDRAKKVRADRNTTNSQ